MFRQLLSRKIALRAATSTIKSQRTQSHLLNQVSGLSGWKALEKFRLKHETDELAEKLKSDSSPRLQLQYIRSLAQYDPKKAQTTIQSWWEAGVPVTEEMMTEFVKALVVTGDINQLGFRQLAEFYQSKQGIKGVKDGVDVSSLLARQSSLQQAFSAGSSPNEPLYIAYRGSDWKSQMWKLGRHGLTLFILVALIGTFLDEKGAASNIGQRFSMGAAVHRVEKSEKTFEDVVGIDEAKTELQEIVMYLKDPKKFTRLGGKLPKGVLLTGPPGTGKTLLARAIAGEAQVPFFHASGSEFEEMYVGVGAKRVRELFEVAKTHSPCIIFIDEIDAIGGSRHLKDQSAMKMTLNQLLVEMDGFQQNNGIIVIAATNFPDSLDSALVRPGRFDKTVDVPMPDIGGRKAILSLYCTRVPVDPDVDLDQLARGTPGFSGAELFNLVNQAALKASVDGMKTVTMHALEYAKDKILMGAERRSAIISPETMKMTAFHEAGHALVALKTKGADPVHKATIMPRGRALGMVVQLPDGDQTSMSKQQMLAKIDVCMGGRVAEELIFGADNVTSGASSDIQQATRLARAMVMKFGLSNKVGIMFIDDKQHLSASTQDDIDREVRDILTQSYARAKHILENYNEELAVLANGLMEYESLSGSEVVDLINGKKISQLKRSQKPSRQVMTIEEIKEKNRPGVEAQPLPHAVPLTDAPHGSVKESSLPVDSKAVEGKVESTNPKSDAVNKSTIPPKPSANATSTAQRGPPKI
eukprot:gene16403-18607_t